MNTNLNRHPGGVPVGGRFKSPDHADPSVASLGSMEYSKDHLKAAGDSAAEAVYGAMCDDSVSMEDDGTGVQLVIGEYEGAALSASCPVYSSDDPSAKWQCRSSDGGYFIEHPTLGADGDPGEVAQWLYEVREELGLAQPQYRAAW